MDGAQGTGHPRQQEWARPVCEHGGCGRQGRGGSKRVKDGAARREEERGPHAGEGERRNVHGRVGRRGGAVQGRGREDDGHQRCGAPGCTAGAMMDGQGLS